MTGPVAGEGRGNVAADGAPPPMKGTEALFPFRHRTGPSRTYRRYMTGKISAERYAAIVDRFVRMEMAYVRAKRHEKVVGRCPMGCGATLFLGSGGHVTCSWEHCPDPGAADDLLRSQP